MFYIITCRLIPEALLIISSNPVKMMHHFIRNCLFFLDLGRGELLKTPSKEVTAIAEG